MKEVKEIEIVINRRIGQNTAIKPHRLWNHVNKEQALVAYP